MAQIEMSVDICEMYICKSICSRIYVRFFLMSKGVRDRQRNHVYLPGRVRFVEQGCWSLGRTLRSGLEEVEPQKLRGLSPTYPDESFGAQNSFEAFSRRLSFIRFNRRETPPRLARTLKKKSCLRVMRCLVITFSRMLLALPHFKRDVFRIFCRKVSFFHFAKK